MKDTDKSVQEMWERYLMTIGENPGSTEMTYQSWYFCDNQEDANELVELVMSGTKRGTASLYILYERANERIPAAGDLSVLTDWDGIARCIIRDKNVTIVPFKDISEEHAMIEGEGDKSLDYWRRAHINFFTRELEGMGAEFNEDVLVVFEEFEVVFQF
jgi:uncharacterized protein YhfF